MKKVRRGSIVYTDRLKSYDSLMFCGYRHLSINHQTHFAKERVYINELEGFWSYVKERLMKHHGVSPEKFPLYFKKLEFRYNDRYDDIYEKVVNYLYNLVPNRE